MSYIQSTINSLLPDPIVITVDPATGLGISEDLDLSYVVIDKNYAAGDPPVNVHVILSIVQATKYTFEDGQTSKSADVQVVDGSYQGDFQLNLKNTYQFGANPLKVVLRLCAYDSAMGTSSQYCNSQQYQVNKA